jgi:predicted HicB family RNase H-like nuclease
MKKLNAQSLTFRIPISLREELETIATENEVSLSELIRYSLKNLVNNEQVV